MPFCGEDRAKEVNAFLENVFNKLTKYEETGLEPDAIEALQQENKQLKKERKVLNELGMSINELVDIAIAKSKGRVAILPCRPGDRVYTISRTDCPCEICIHGKEVGYSALDCVRQHKDYECPPPQYTIQIHICEGFEIHGDADGNPIVSNPGEWGYEGLEQFNGCDGNIYYDYEAVKEAVETLRNNN
jgi:hypothetical protein